MLQRTLLESARLPVGARNTSPERARSEHQPRSSYKGGHMPASHHDLSLPRALLPSCALAAAILFAPAGALAQSAPPSSTIGNLKQLSVEELMDIEVTSVSKEPEKLFDA